MTRLVACLFVCGAVLMSVPAAAQVKWTTAQNGNHSTHHLDVLVASNAGSNLGVAPGVLYGVPVLPTGLTPELNDNLEVEFGVYFHTWFRSDTTYFWLTPVGGVRWSLWLTRTFDIFATLKLGWAIPFNDDFRGGLYAFGGLGFDWAFANSVAFRFELGGGRGGGAAQLGIRFNL